MKALDLSKFRKSLTKNIEGISSGFRDPKHWISTGSLALNYLISGDFHKGIPLGKVSVFFGESGAGKSFLASGSVIKNAQAQGIFVVLIDSENALDESWLKALGVDTDESKLLKINAAMINDVAKIINDFIKGYRADYMSVPEADRPKVLFVLDSLGMMMSPTELNQFEAGDMKGDMGRKAKQLKTMITNCVNMFGDLDIGLVATNHSYASQDPYAPDPIMSGGSGFVYASSIVIGMKLSKLKEDADGNKTPTVQGIRSRIKVTKTRYNKPFEDVELRIPYETGLDPYSGLFELFLKKGVLVQEGKRYKYVAKDGTSNLWWRKDIGPTEFDLIIKEWDENATSTKKIDMTTIEKEEE